MEKANNPVYLLDGKAYINLTNRCPNNCAFCIRNTGDGVAGSNLWLTKEPTADEVFAEFEKLKPQLKSDEVVFCGYGEPTGALLVLLECAEYFKYNGYMTRLNTNGLGNVVNGRDITPLLKNIDTVSISLNAPTAEKYAEITKSKYGARAFDEILDFARKCKAEWIKTVFTVVDVIGDEDIAACKALAEREGIELRIREYISDNYKDSK